MSLTLLFMDGFDQYTTAAAAGYTGASMWSAPGGSLFVGTNYGRFGGVGYSFGSLTYTALPWTSVSVIGMMIAVKPGTTAGTILTIRDSAGNIQGTVFWNIDGSLSVYRGSSSTLLGTSAAGVLPNVYHHVEAQCKVDPSAGTWDIWVDGVCVLSLNGLNTRGSAVVGSGASNVGISGGTTSGQLNDDVCFYDATSRTGASGAGTPASCTFEHFGDKRIQTLMPSGAGTGDVGSFSQVGGTGGSPYTAVNEIPQNGDTSYVADSVASDIKSFALSDLVAGTTGVTALAAVACYEKDDATSRTCAVGIRTSSTNAFGATRGSPSTYSYTEDIFTLDGSGAALSVAGVNGSEILFKVVS